MEEVAFKDRLVSALSYLSAGWVGLFYLIVLYFMKKSSTRFLRYNVFQSIFLALALFLISEICKIIFNIILAIPFVNMVLSTLLLLINKPIIYLGPNVNYSLLQLAVSLFFLYLAGMSFIGRYPKVYWISENIIVKASK